jgi:hypothetical protein
MRSAHIVTAKEKLGRGRAAWGRASALLEILELLKRRVRIYSPRRASRWRSSLFDAPRE